jgi:hypothetical protein
MVRFWCGLAMRAGAVLLACAHLALAQPAPVVTGSEVPAFRQAVDLWLTDDDESAALAALAALAAGGNPAAQILLGLIDKSPTLQGPWLSRLGRADRVALMRAPGGLSGRSWLSAAADEPLAAAWLALLRTDAGPEVGARLAGLGELRAAREALLILAAREHPALATHWHDWMDLELAFAVWHRARPAVRAQLAAQVDPGHPQRALMGLPGTARGWDDWLADSPAAVPLRSLCAAECPDSQPACRRAALAALGSPAAVLTLGSPAASLISEARFQAAPRGRAAILRRMQLTADARGRPALIARTAAADACLGARLAADAERYRSIRNGTTVPDG